MNADKIIFVEFHIFLFRISEIRPRAYLQRQQGRKRLAGRILHIIALGGGGTTQNIRPHSMRMTSIIVIRQGRNWWRRVAYCSMLLQTRLSWQNNVSVILTRNIRCHWKLTPVQFISVWVIVFTYGAKELTGATSVGNFVRI